MKTSLPLLCVDDSEQSLITFNWYFEHIYQRGYEVDFIHVHVPPELPSMGLIHGAIELYTKSIEKSISQSKMTIKKYQDLCSEKKIKANFHLKPFDDSIGHTICKHAKENNSSLIVIGQRGLGTIRRTLFGGVSDYVLHHSHIPTIVVPRLA